jgi:hypothetical protein
MSGLRNIKKNFSRLFALGVCFLVISITIRALPIVREKESYRRHFPKERFQAKLTSTPPSWIVKQIDQDFRDFEGRGVTASALEKTFQYICQNVSQKTPFYHYRILDNQLYKFVPEGSRFSDTDNSFEKSFKTLLIYAKVPDVDFILCPMDGMPEPYMPPDFYRMKDSQDQAPILAQAKLKEPLTKYIALIPDQFSLQDGWDADAHEVLALSKKIGWEQKKEMAVWRGGPTDLGVPNRQLVPNFESSPRFKLCKQSAENPSLVDAGFNWVEEHQKPLLQKEGVIREGLSKRDHLLCKYLPALDGHMCTYPGYQWRLLSNSVCFKQESDQVQWFYPELKPYVHYIPVKNDMSDFLSQIEWAKSHDDEAREISKQAQNFARDHLLMEGNYFYLYLVFKKLSSIEKIDFLQLKRETKSDPRWKCIQYRKRLALKKTFDRSLQRIANLLQICSKKA